VKRTLKWNGERFRVQSEQLTGNYNVKAARYFRMTRFHILKKLQLPRQGKKCTWCISLFTETQVARTALDWFYIFFSGVITFKNAADIRSRRLFRDRL
jgi:hypothetical protein